MIKTSSNKACNYFSLLFTLLVQHSELQACSLYFCCCKIPLALCIFPSWFLPFSPSLLMCHTPVFALEWILLLIPIDYLCVHWQFHRARFGGRGLGGLFKLDSPCSMAGTQVMTCGFITGHSLLSFRLVTTQLPFMPGFLFSFVHLSSLVWNATRQTLSDCQWRDRTLRLSPSVNSIFLVVWRHFHPILAKPSDFLSGHLSRNKPLSWAWLSQTSVFPCLLSPIPRDCTCKCSPMC